MRFSKKELKDLFVAWFMISLAFTILFSGIENLLSLNFIFLISFIISALTVGVSFLLHELMHKYFAQKYGLWAEFRASYNMLFLALLFSFFGFIIAAPGAVMIQGVLTKEKNGKISLAGPMTNIVLAFLFLMFILFAKLSALNLGGILGMFLIYGLLINSLLALFNLIPLGPFDGRKIYVWSKPVYILTIIFALFLFLSRYFI